MTARKQRTIKTIAFCLAFSLLQFYAQASSEQPGIQAQDAATRPPHGLGLLSTTGDREILVDKVLMDTGATILNAARLETMDCTSATVRWGPLNRVDLATNTIAVINYREGILNVTLEKGCARVRVQPGVEGSISTPDGNMIPATGSDSLNRKHGEVCYPPTNNPGDNSNNPSYEPSCIPPIVWIFGGGGAAAVIAAVVAPRGADPSPDTPIVR